MPFTWELSCVEPIGGLTATGNLRSQVDLLRLSTAGGFSFSCCTGDTTGVGFFDSDMGFAIARVQARVNITGGSGSGTLRMTILFAGSGAGSRAEATSGVTAELIEFGTSLGFARQSPGTLVADFPFVFGTPLESGVPARVVRLQLPNA